MLAAAAHRAKEREGINHRGRRERREEGKWRTRKEPANSSYKRRGDTCASPLPALLSECLPLLRVLCDLCGEFPLP